jgi:LmbE family N-acetylglucosaminyl deacetylase
MLTLALRPAKPPLRVLCLGAHSDDLEIGAGGTVRRLAREHPGAVFRWVVFSAAGERADEARKSAGWFLAGAGAAEVEVHAFRESYFPWAGAEIKDAFEALKRSFEPDLVLTHCGGDAHQDHRTLAELTANTFRDHLLLEYEIPKYDGDLGRPNFYVPLSRVDAEAKVRSLMQHFGSQRSRAWFTPDTFLALMRLRGVECNAPEGFAEAFYGRKVVL